MGDVEKKPGAYFFPWWDERIDINTFLKMAHELHRIGFDDEKFQRVMILNPQQINSFLNSISQSGLELPSARNFHEWIFAGFMIRTLRGVIE